MSLRDTFANCIIDEANFVCIIVSYNIPNLMSSLELAAWPAFYAVLDAAITARGAGTIVREPLRQVLDGINFFHFFSSIS